MATSSAVTPRADIVVIRETGGLELEPGAGIAVRCRGSMALTLLKGRQVIARRTVRLNGRCRWSVTFRVDRTRLGTARFLHLRQRFAGNAYIEAGVGVRRVPVPRA